MRSALDPDREQASPGFFAAFPTLRAEAARAPARATRSPTSASATPGTTVAALLAQAAARGARGSRTSFTDLVGPPADSRAALDLEADLARRPRRRGGAGASSPARRELQQLDRRGAGRSRTCQFVADGVDEDKAREALAALQGPLAEAIGSGGAVRRRSSASRGRRRRGAQPADLADGRRSPTRVFDGLAAIATDPAGSRGSPPATAASTTATGYKAATDGFGDEVVAARATSTSTTSSRSPSELGLGRGSGLRDRSPATSAASTRSASRSSAPTTCSRPTPGS